MPKLLIDLEPGDYVRGYLFKCLYCDEPAVGRQGALFCSTSCRHAQRHYDREKEEDRLKVTRLAEEDLALLRRFHPEAATLSEAAEHISAHVSGSEILAAEGLGQSSLNRIAKLVYRQGFRIRNRPGPVKPEDLVPVAINTL